MITKKQKDLFEQATIYACDYMENIPGRTVVPRESAMQASGSYIQYSERRDGMLYVPDMSRRARAVELWATLKSLGRRGVENLVDGLCDRAVQFADQLGIHGFHILNNVVFNQILVACDSPQETETTLEYIQRSGECWCGATTWKNKPAIRISVCSWATDVGDIDRSVASFVDARERARFGVSFFVVAKSFEALSEPGEALYERGFDDGVELPPQAANIQSAVTKTVWGLY